MPNRPRNVLAAARQLLKNLAHARCRPTELMIQSEVLLAHLIR